MKKLISMVALFAAVIGCQTAKADQSSTTYYGKATVAVAEDSKGLGTVYFIDKDENGNEITATEISGSITDTQIPPKGYGAWNIKLKVDAAEGYVLANFTDQDGKIYNVDGNSVTLECMSKDEAAPSTFNLLAHFIDESLLVEQELVEVTVSDANRYATFCAPIEVTAPEDLVVYNVTGIDADAVTIVKRADNVIPAFTPVLLKNDGWAPVTVSATYTKNDIPEEIPAMQNGLLTGVLEETLVPAGVYTLPADGNNVEFTKVTTDDVTIPAYTAYMIVTGDETLASYSYKEVEDNGGNTGINAVFEGLKDGNIYTIDGVKIDSLQEGINIVNGVKVIVK
ncbi:MAG: hypothetical protein NC328_08230 [Muribaculum sp.]|nr:hypothetical protein [Muribaculum sp.]